MANIKGIELANEIYDLEDETARSTATAASQTATAASQTATVASQTATAASQTATTASETATVASQTATAASQTATAASQTATAASQTATQADSKIGNLANLVTTDKTSLVGAINENRSFINALAGMVQSSVVSNKTFTLPQGAYISWAALTGLSQYPKIAMFQMTEILVNGQPSDSFVKIESSIYGYHLVFRAIATNDLLVAGTQITVSGNAFYIS